MGQFLHSDGPPKSIDLVEQEAHKLIHHKPRLRHNLGKLQEASLEVSNSELNLIAPYKMTFIRNC